MDNFFREHPYEPVGSTDLEQDIELAVHLLIFLKSTQDPTDGVWYSQGMLATLRNTCHMLDALNLLNFPVLDPDLLDAATKWLINLPGLERIAPEDEEQIRLYPSRFKTLISLGVLDDAGVCSDFDELHRHLSDDDLISGVMPRSVLATLIYLDCLDMLAQERSIPEKWRGGRARALKAVLHEVRLWYRDQQDGSSRSQIRDNGDLSYAVDVLLRNGELDRDAELVQAAKNAMLKQIKKCQRTDPISSDTLYCGIQLSRHFPDESEARTLTRRLIHDIRIRYQQANLEKATDFFHALVLRLLCARHGDALQAGMIRRLLERQEQTYAIRGQSEEQQKHSQLAEIIRDKLDVKIEAVQSLSGGITGADVLRVKFCFEFVTASEEADRPNHTHKFTPTPDSLVIKRDSLDRIRRSIREYEQLPDVARPYFARHVGPPRMIPGDATGMGFLILEDLTNMDTLRDVLNRLDQGALSAANTGRIDRACSAICDAAFTVFLETYRDSFHFFGTQLYKLYFSRIEASLTELTRYDRFPRLKPWFSGFLLDNRRFLSVDHYLNKVSQHREVLRVPHLGLVHGDFHSRNIMLDETLQKIKLVDLDHVTFDGDYISDFACLLEDVCVFRFLTDGEYRLHLDLGKVVFPSASDRGGKPDVSYPVISSEAACHFQRSILRRLEGFAEVIKDKYWKERLWLALASALFQLAVKQQDERCAAVAFVEGVKLLDELSNHLIDGSTPLVEIPFPDRHRGGIKLSSGGEPGPGGLPDWCQEGSALGELHRRLVSPEIGLRCHFVSAGAQYFWGNRSLPVAVIDAKRRKLLLPRTPDDFDDPKRLTIKRPTKGVFRTAVPVSMSDIDDIIDLAKQVLD